MGLFSKFTEKKECGICGKELGLLGKSKVEDGYICKECREKLSPFFDERRHTTLVDIQGQLDCREENKKIVAKFRPERQIGDSWRVLIDDTGRWVVITRDDDWRARNADVIGFDDVKGADVRVEEDRRELTYVDDDGNTRHYEPPRYDTDYDFWLTVHTSVPYIGDIRFKVNNWSVKERFSAEYDRNERLAGEMRDALRSLNAPSAGYPGAQGYTAGPQGATGYGVPQGAGGYGAAPASPMPAGAPSGGAATVQPGGAAPAYAPAPQAAAQTGEAVGGGPRFCSNCGAPAVAGARFCESCGSPLAG